MKFDVANRLIWLNGKFVHVNDAKINVLSPSAQFGLNVFEGIPCYWSETARQLNAFRLKDHYRRLMRSARLLQIDNPYSMEQMQQALFDIVQANEYRENIVVRQTLFADGFGSWGSSEPVGMFVAPIPRKKISREYISGGLNICCSSWQRISENVLSPRVKCGANYINSRYGQREALRNGYDTCFFLNEKGKVTEGPGSCLFMVKDGVLTTPLLTDGVLESITRDTVIRIACDHGIRVVERSIDRMELYAGDEIFLCGSAMEVTPVFSVDRYGLPADNPVTQRIRKAYFEILCGENEKYADWLTSCYAD